MASKASLAARPPAALAVILPLALAAVLALLVTAFAWPASRIAPRDVPVGLAGPQPAVDALAARIAAERPGALELHRYADEAIARAAIADRDVYGAIVLPPDEPRVLVASAGSPAVAQLLAQIGQGAAGATDGQPAPVEDVVAAPEQDPRGTGLAATILPLVLAAMVAAAALTLTVSHLGWRMVGLALFALVAGVTATAIVQLWLGALDGPFWGNAGVLALTLLAVGGLLAGLGAAFGRVGLGAGAAIVLLLGNPLSGIASAPELLPQPWGEIGQFLPPGAGGTLLRSVAFFDGAASAAPLAVLSGWVALGLALFLAAGVRSARSRRLARLEGTTPQTSRPTAQIFSTGA
jgi:hypothetical protein